MHLRRKSGRMTLLEMGCSRRRHKRVQLGSRERELSPASRMTGRFQSIQSEDHSKYSANARAGPNFQYSAGAGTTSEATQAILDSRKRLVAISLIKLVSELVITDRHK